jgi:hypothetical protein
MSDFDPTAVLRERYECLAARRIELREELDPLELEMAKLQAGLHAMGALDIGEVLAEKVTPPAALRLIQTEMHEAIAHQARVRNPEVQKAIDTQTPSVAIPKDTKLWCSQGCINGDAGGFTDQLALRTHTKRNHDREPTDEEKVPR